MSAAADRERERPRRPAPGRSIAAPRRAPPRASATNVVVVIVSGLAAMAATPALGARGATDRAIATRQAAPVPSRGHGSQARRATSLLRWTAPSGRFELNVPAAGLQIESERYADAAAEQLDERATFADDGRVVMSVDAFANPAGEDIDAWLAGGARALLGERVRVERLGELPRGATGVRLHSPRTPQTYARTIVLITAPGLRLRMTCEDATDAAGRRLLDAAVTGLRLLAPAKAKR